MRICILGATGLVGRESIDLVARAWPGADLSLFASRDQQLEHGGQTWHVDAAAKLERDDAPRGELALVALDDLGPAGARVGEQEQRPSHLVALLVEIPEHEAEIPA